MRTSKSSGPGLELVLVAQFRSPFTGSSLTNVPLVLSKSRMNTLPLRTSTAQ